jgi:CheY-like chemotaxis protein
MRCVLVVDDDPMFARAVGRDLDEHGFAVSVVHGVADALSRLAIGDVDVLVTDLQLGAEDGIDLLESVRGVSPRTRAILMSAFASARDYQRALELGAVSVLCKPFTPSQLIDCVRQAVECETGFRGSVHGLSLIDMLQMFNHGRRSVSIAVAGESPARVYMDGGQIVHVEHESRVGEPALQTLLAMPGGTLTTSVLPPSYDTSVTRDFHLVLLDALRTIDEVGSGLQVKVDPSVSGHGERGSEAEMLERMRHIDGYVASCIALASDGELLGADGALDLSEVSSLSAEILRRAQETIADMGLDEEVQEILVTGSRQYHLLRNLPSVHSSFVHLVLDRDLTNPAMAKLSLAKTVRPVDL